MLDGHLPTRAAPASRQHGTSCDRSSLEALENRTLYAVNLYGGLGARKMAIIQR
jgi:hypothetical protein